jgi:transcriptional antiterminator RfaH
MDMRDDPSGDELAAMALQPALQWVLVLTKPLHERVAEENLQRQGYGVYYPRLLRRQWHGARWLERIVALFPRYLFVHFDVRSQSLAPVGSTKGVAQVVRFGAQPAVVPPTVIEHLQRQADPCSGLHRLRKQAAPKAGSPVSIVAGALRGLEAVFEREDGEDRVIVLLKLLGATTSVRLPSRCIAQVA